jgi:pyruvate dehydrogenase E1 component alpha subunit
VSGRDARVELLGRMIRIRRFEERCAELYAAGSIRGFLHLGVGQEAVAVGVTDALAPGDPVTATYREHGHALARGISADRIMAEMFGKREGLCRGRGGSMHLFEAARAFYGGNAIVAGALPLAVGFALGLKMRGDRRVVACFFGEGAMAEGEFHESMNLAALWRLPVLFLCENNLYAMGTALARSESQTDLCVKAASYKVRTASVDGMDVAAVHEATRRAVRDVRELGEPYFVEFRTYRFRAHSMFDPDLYRDRAEVERWKQRDPVKLLTERLLREGLLQADAVASLEKDVGEEVAAAVASAERGTLEPVEDLTRFVYAEPEETPP